MKRAKLLSLSILSAAALFLVLGCNSPEKNTIAITSFGWIYENIDASFWLTTPPTGTAFYDFFIYYTGNIAFKDIASATVTAPDGATWNVIPNSNYFDAQHNLIGGYGHFWDSNMLHVLPIGNFEVEVRLNDGTDAKYTALIPAPGSTAVGSYTSMHSEDASSPPANSAAMPVRATIGTATFTGGSTISIQFTVNDSLVNNGYVWFYDSTNNYLGRSAYFRDPATGSVSATLGVPTPALDTAGGTNTLTLGSSDITLASGVASSTFLSSAAQFIIVLTDGKQYPANGSSTLRYDGRSISARTPLP